ncbi:MAG: hypothetical protein AAF216_12730 [Pseudomonadota bacterium]
MTEHEANELATKIEAYWRAKGCAVTVVPERTVYDPKLRAVRYELRSNLVNGACPNCGGKGAAGSKAA